LQADRNLYFPSVERFRNTLDKASLDETINRIIILDMSRVNQVDYTSLKVNCYLDEWINITKFNIITSDVKIDAVILEQEGGEIPVHQR